MRKILFISLIFMNMPATKAQFVNIPDTNFRNWLNMHGFASCMNGNMMDTTCSAVVNATVVSCDNSNIYNLEGIQYFDHLQTLGCGANHLSSLLFNFPNTLWAIQCDLNQITQIGNLPASLTGINCDYNQLSSLPSLPPSLEFLSCQNNQIAWLPSLPTTLARLYCNGNQLSNFTFVLPSSLYLFDCSNNQLTSLPNLPAGLGELHCDFNQLTSLPALPSSLISLTCGFNQLSSLSSLPSTLDFFICRSNQLTSLPPLTSSLTSYFDCGVNQLNYIPDLPDSINQVFIDDNPLNCFPKYKKINQLYWSNTGITCLPNAGTILYASPSINTLPLCFSISASGPTTFCNVVSVPLNAFTGNNSTYQWKKNGTNISGATASSYIASTSGNYSVHINNSCGSDISSPVTVTANSLPSAAITPSGSTTFCSGESVELTVPYGANKTYQWKKGAVNISGATLSDYTTTVGGNYKLIVTNTVTGCSKTSTNPTVVTVNPLPNATITPQGPTTFCAGGSVVLHANTGTGLIYQWKKGGNNIGGATNINYTASLGGNYKVRVTNSSGCSKMSSGVTVTVPCREEEISENDFSVKVFPNPSSGDFVFDLKDVSVEKISIDLYDMVGKLILSETKNNSPFTLQIPRLAPGIYSAIIVNGENKKILKLIKK